MLYLERMKKYVTIITLSVFLNSVSSFANQTAGGKEQPKSQSLQIDTAKQLSIEQILNLAPGLKVKKCEAVISSEGTIYKFDYGETSLTESAKKLWERLKKTHHNDVLFIDNILVTKDGKLMKMDGQRAFAIQ